MRAFRASALLLLGGVAVLAACAAVAGIDDLVIGECKGGVCAPDSSLPPVDPDSGAVVPVDSGVPCLGKPLPPSIRVGTSGNTFCIDTTEVSYGMYAEFLDAGVPTSSQGELCTWNETFVPDENDAGPELPAVGIDWCDAVAYCTWAGKYLCGRNEDGKKVGPVTVETVADYRSHQWMNACSADARLRYPYGGVFDPNRCNFVELDAGGPVPVGTTACQGGYVGVNDLLGNVWEWYDGPCRPDPTPLEDGGVGGPESDNCWLKGGSWNNEGAPIDCRFDLENIRRDRRLSNVGFRCCSD